MANEYKLKQDIVEIGRRMYMKGFVASNDGNLSIRMSDHEILITPTGVSKGYMTPSDILKVNLSGKVLSGNGKPTSEMKMHLVVYQKRPDVFAVVHAHPPVATAFAVARKICDKIALPEVIFSLGLISLAEYGTPTTDELPRSIEKSLVGSDAILLSNHGALTLGKDIYDAYYKMETVEHFSTITMYARILGGEQGLDQEQVRDLFQIRRSVYGKPDPVITDDAGLCGGSSIASLAEQADAAAANSGEQEPADGDIKEKIRRIVQNELAKLT